MFRYCFVLLPISIYLLKLYPIDVLKTDFLFHCAMFVSWYDALLTRSPRNLTHVKTYGVFCLLFQCSKIRIKDLCRWSYVKLFGLYMHHDSEDSSHGSRGRRSSIMPKNLQILKYLHLLALFLFSSFLQIFEHNTTIKYVRLPWEETSESWCI